MSGISRHSALIIQSHGDYDGTDGIQCEWVRHPNGKYAGWITFWRDKRPHISPLISTEPVFESGADAEAAMKEQVAKIRALDVLVDAPA